MKSVAPLMFLAAAVFGAGTAEAHIGVSSGPAQADTSQEINFGVGHGCGTSDTLAVTIEIPAGITSIRPLTSDFGKPAVIKDGAGAVTSVTWTKPVADLHDSDLSYYVLRMRARTPNAPFTRIYFKIHQTCRAMDGTETVVDWVALPGEEGEAAATLMVIPKKFSGWNQFTLPVGTPQIVAADLPKWFGDTQIVWSGNAAYSPSPTTTSLIGTTTGVTALSTLDAGATLWVKY